MFLTCIFFFRCLVGIQRSLVTWPYEVGPVTAATCTTAPSETNSHLPKYLVINELVIGNKRSCCLLLQWRLPQQLLRVCWSTKLCGGFHLVHFNLGTHRPKPRGLLHRHPYHSGAGQHQGLGKTHIHGTLRQTVSI